MPLRGIVCGMILFVTVVGLVSLGLPSLVVPTFTTETTTATGVLVVFPGLTYSTTNNSTLWFKVEMTNTVTVISEVTHTGSKTIPLYSSFGWSEPKFMLLAIFTITLVLCGILWVRANSHPVSANSQHYNE